MRSGVTAGTGCLAVVCLMMYAATAGAQESRTVIGPSNIDLHAGAEALRHGDAGEGLRLTLAGLEYAATTDEKVAGMSNACAACLMLERPGEALDWCDGALEISGRHWRALSNRALAYLKLGRLEDAEADIRLAEELAPGALSVRTVRALLRDATDPVVPQVIVDDRRQPPDAGNP